jgi:phosphohistidine phosphatase
MLSKLWIMRHGLAKSEFSSDFERELSATGENEALRVVEQMLEQETELPQQMLVSPFKRTQQTANIVYKNLKIQAPFETEDMLVHFADAKLLGDYLLACGHKNLMIVSHMPIVAALCQYLVADCKIYAFATAQVVKLSFDMPVSSSELTSVQKTQTLTAGKATIEKIYLA